MQFFDDTDGSLRVLTAVFWAESAIPDDVNVSPRHPRKAKMAFRVKAVRPKRMNS
jgi:hypothetical protein